MTDEPTRPTGPYTRFRGKLQLGEDVNRRGDISVEIVREFDPTKLEDMTIETPEGTTVAADVPRDHRAFAEFYAELERADRLLRERLGMEVDDG